MKLLPGALVKTWSETSVPAWSTAQRMPNEIPLDWMTDDVVAVVIVTHGELDVSLVAFGDQVGWISNKYLVMV